MLFICDCVCSKNYVWVLVYFVLFDCSFCLAYSMLFVYYVDLWPSVIALIFCDGAWMIGLLHDCMSFLPQVRVILWLSIPRRGKMFLNNSLFIAFMCAIWDASIGCTASWFLDLNTCRGSCVNKYLYIACLTMLSSSFCTYVEVTREFSR